MDRREVARSLFNGSTRDFGVELWDGTLLPGTKGEVANRVILKKPESLDVLLPPVSERRLAEAFVAETIELAGDTIQLLETAAKWTGPNLNSTLFFALLSAWPHRIALRSQREIAARLNGRTHSANRDSDAVRHHYDISNEFYKLFLDPLMVYSCAYFPTGTESLEEAQRAKLELTCRKLNLQPNEKMLDIGCGWGGLLSFAGDEFGVRGVGLTLSQRQLSEARRRLSKFGDRFDIRALDYRALSDVSFDKVASIGMMEHVGESHVDEYFAKVFSLLRPGGLFLNHAIADTAVELQTIPWVRQRRGGFIRGYIFPDSELIPIPRVVQAAESAGFEVRDLENLREHYAETLTLWLRNLEEHFDQAVRMVGQPRARAWRLYLASSAVAFRLGRIGVYQLLLVKRLSDGRAPGLPRNRIDWYTDRSAFAPRTYPLVAGSNIPSNAELHS